jgi:tRNA(Ile)-lysidine synthase
LDDNVETLLMHFFRGTGMRGLSAMLPKHGNLVRPLLFAKKEELKDYAHTRQLLWVEDSSNDLDKYPRNYLRQSVLPAIEKIYPGAVANLAGNIERFRDIEWIYGHYFLNLKMKLFERRGCDIHIPVAKLKKAIPLQTICFEICREFGFSAPQTGELIALLDSESGKLIASSTHRIIRHRNWLIISPHEPVEPQTILIEQGTLQARGPHFTVRLTTAPVASCTVQANPAVAFLDLRAVRFPLLIRKWKPGDYFYPLGMRKKKKLARFFIDQKLSKLDKEKMWVMESDQKIIWVMGLRIDERFKITPQTADVLKIEMRVP